MSRKCFFSGRRVYMFRYSCDCIVLKRWILKENLSQACWIVVFILSNFPCKYQPLQSITRYVVIHVTPSRQPSIYIIQSQGYPFRERIQDNKTLYYGLMSVGGIALAGATEMFPEVNEQLKLVKFPSAVSILKGESCRWDLGILIQMLLMLVPWQIDTRHDPRLWHFLSHWSDNQEVICWQPSQGHCP